MSWFNKASFTHYAQEALNQAQASIDKALEIEPTQDPLSGSTSGRKPKTPPTKRGAKKEADDWATWSASAVNNFWDSSSTAQDSKPSDSTPSPSKKSNVLKLGGTRKSKSSLSATKARIPAKVIQSQDVSDEISCSSVINKSIPSNPPSLKDVSPFESAVLTGESVDVDDDNASLFEKEIKPEPLLKSSSSSTLKPVTSSGSLASHETQDLHASETFAAKDPLTPTLSSCSSSSALSMMKSTSSNSSEQSLNTSVCTLTADPAPVIEDTVDEDAEEAVSTSPENQEGWSEEEILDLDKTSSDQDSRSSMDLTEHKRCLSIGSTTSSSILMLQSPHESNGDKSDEKSDEDSSKTPTNIVLQPTPKLELTHETICEEVPTFKNVPSRIITSPTHSDKSDMIVLNSEDAQSPDSSEMMRLKEILHAREQRLFKMNQEYVDVQDELQNERQRSYTLEQNLNILSQKHTISVEQLEEELSAIEELKDSLEEELQQLKELGNIEDLKRDIDEKDQLIEELTVEGEKLAQSSFNNANNVKKLRQKEKEDEKIIKDKSDKIENLSKNIDDLKSKIKCLEKSLSEGAQNVSELNTIIKTQSQDLADTRAKLENTEAENISLKQKAEDYIKQIAVLKEQTAKAESKATKESLSANIKAREEARSAVDELRASSEATIKQQNTQIIELQEVIARLEQQAFWREQRHRDQTQELHSRVEDADGRNQDISTSITASTQPLLRQIQLYKESLTNQQINWEKIEVDLNEKLNKARADLSEAEMEKRDLSDKLQLTKNKATSYQAQLDSVRSERNELEVTVEVAQSKVVLLEEERKKYSAKSDSFKAQFLQSLEDSTAECDQLREELHLSQSMVRELESSKSIISEAEDIASRSSTPPIDYTSQTHILERSLYGSNCAPSSPTYSVPAVSSYGMEKIHSQLKQSQSEILSYQEQIRSLTLSKASLSTEITRVSERCSQLEIQCERLPAVKKEKMELQTRYDTLLAMYGEKMEEMNELQLDLTDVKEAYKAQIEQLLAKVIK